MNEDVDKTRTIRMFRKYNQDNQHDLRAEINLTWDTLEILLRVQFTVTV